jgi:hypothetical protein
MCTSPTSDFAIYRRLVRHARPYWPHILALSAVSGQHSRLPPLRSFITGFYPIDRGPTAFWRSRRGSFELAFALLDEVPDVTEKPAARPIARAARSNSAESRSHIRMDRRCIGISRSTSVRGRGSESRESRALETAAICLCCGGGSWWRWTADASQG